MLAFALGACDKQETASEAKTPAAGQETAPDAKASGEVAQADTKVKTIPGKDPADDRFALSIEPPSEAAAGEESVVKIKVLPKEPWHMNHDYPTTLTIDPPGGVSLAKGELKRGDAVKFEDAGCEFDVAFTPSETGEKTFSGKFRFAICQDEACAPVSEDVEFRVAVK
ncbi:MAG: hypothetical protein H6713_30665 [Myxococcales bacterium]|nr:hypothetical protein [Myxococcales bacterium]MCB9754327.1 hypothetical protein [Myxococcales bacterium]